MSKKMLYAGSFDPLTCGHMDIIKRGAALTDEFVVGVLNNKAKTYLLSAEERVALIKQCVRDIPGVSVDSFDGLLADYVNENKIDIVLRGLRAATDFEYEIIMAQMNSRLYTGGVETMFLMTAPEHSFISSSMVKEVFSYGGDISGLVPESVIKYMAEKQAK